MADRRDETQLPKKRIRKPRGRGLRTKTGCITCRQRHKKCDEKQPVCSPCSISSRRCVFPQNVNAGESVTRLSHDESRPEAVSTTNHANKDVLVTPSDERPAPQLAENFDTALQSTPYASQQQPLAPTGLTLGEVYSYSPETVASELWTTDLASTRWLGLLATDAAQADSGFSLAPSPAPEDDEQRRGPAAHGPPDATNLQSRLTSLSDSERKTWRADRYIILTNHEAVLFRHFTERSSRWLDFLDPDKLFSTYAVRLALRNAGLTNAILALSAKHLSKLSSSRAEDNPSYVQEAPAYPSYTNSEELNATAIVISAYEMLDESDGRGNWQRHLKGIFWIQRSQNVDGYSGGLQQAVWWAWLRQDLWAAFREERRCLSFWAPHKDYHELDQHGLAHMAIYLLSQAVNFCADSRLADSSPVPNPSMTTNVVLTGNELSARMERWKSHLGNEFEPLPMATSPSDVFSPLWLHPPQFAHCYLAFVVF
ncbi:Adhesion and hyphal regulator 1 [Colletotrichum trifolii]|uniref:Adhesion and hyphal regulator 1 n=1 Tax=Colletotrichum trifolii TaxID=5466 RepID=A0A4R8QSR4_COLTR|nr:Adhesion and hyphal regulator 1 [Colletotrichum trifolii]